MDQSRHVQPLCGSERIPGSERTWNSRAIKTKVTTTPTYLSSIRSHFAIDMDAAVSKLKIRRWPVNSVFSFWCLYKHFFNIGSAVWRYIDLEQDEQYLFREMRYPATNPNFLSAFEATVCVWRKTGQQSSLAHVTGLSGTLLWHLVATFRKAICWDSWSLLVVLQGTLMVRRYVGDILHWRYSLCYEVFQVPFISKITLGYIRTTFSTITIRIYFPSISC